MKFATKKELIATGIILPLIILLYIEFMSQNSHNVETARFRATRSKMTPLETAIETFRVHTKNYPEKLEDLVTSSDRLKEKWQGPYLKEIQLLDPWGNPFIYKIDAYDPNFYVIISFGKDGKPGGKGYNADIYNVDRK